MLTLRKIYSCITYYLVLRWDSKIMLFLGVLGTLGSMGKVTHVLDIKAIHDYRGALWVSSQSYIEEILEFSSST